MADHTTSGSTNDVLVPLIDVLLVVLCFVLWAGVTHVKMPLKSAAPQESSAVARPLVRIEMQPRGFWTWNGRPLRDEELRGRLQEQNLQGKSPTLVLIPSDELTLLEVSQRFNSLEVLAGDRLQLQLPSQPPKS